MTTRTLVLNVALVLGVGGLWLLARPGAAARPALQNESGAQSKRSDFMKLKLDYAKGVLEGLTLENLELVAKNARLLKEMSAAAQWEVATVPGMEYNEYTADFQRVATDLGKQAREGNLDAATIEYVRLTLSCVRCHKYVRSVGK